MLPVEGNDDPDVLILLFGEEGMNRSPKLLHLASWKSIHVIEHKDQMSLKALVELLHPFRIGWSWAPRKTLLHE